MFSRYNLKVSYKGNSIFNADFTSINKMLKIACFFTDECFLYAYDYLCDKSFTDTVLHNLMEEFKHGEIFI